MYTKLSRHITSRILGVFRRGHERTWFSNILYSATPQKESHSLLTIISILSTLSWCMFFTTSYAMYPKLVGVQLLIT